MPQTPTKGRRKIDFLFKLKMNLFWFEKNFRGTFGGSSLKFLKQLCTFPTKIDELRKSIAELNVRYGASGSVGYLRTSKLNPFSEE